MLPFREWNIRFGDRLSSQAAKRGCLNHLFYSFVSIFGLLFSGVTITRFPFMLTSLHRTGLDPVFWTRCHLGYAASASVVETLGSLALGEMLPIAECRRWALWRVVHRNTARCVVA